MAQRLGFVGGGQMARALATAFVAAGRAEADRITFLDPSPQAGDLFGEAIPGAGRAADNEQLCGSSDIIFLAVKPQIMAVAMQQTRPHLDGQLIVSIAAGITLEKLTSGLETQRVVRVMPNTPCLVGLGACGFAWAGGVEPADVQTVETLLEAVGVAVRVREDLLDAVTGLSGSGPAYVYTLIEALSDGGVRMGLPREVATKLAVQTVRGSAEMVIASEQHPALLREQVTSPGGTTIAGLQALEDRGFRAALIAAVQAATQRSQQLADS